LAQQRESYSKHYSFEGSSSGRKAEYYSESSGAETHARMKVLRDLLRNNLGELRGKGHQQ